MNNGQFGLPRNEACGVALVLDFLFVADFAI
jgi:hypothetical protein